VPVRWASLFLIPPNLSPKRMKNIHTASISARYPAKGNMLCRSGQERTYAMTHLKDMLQTVVALLKAGPWGRPLVTHHHLHKG
jgi:hypothetical protein